MQNTAPHQLPGGKLTLSQLKPGHCSKSQPSWRGDRELCSGGGNGKELGLPWDGICLLAWLQGWPWDLCEGTPWLSDPLRALLQLWESLMNIVTPARSSAVLLLLEQLSAPRADQQLCFLQVLLRFANSQNKLAKERAMERIWRLTGFISSCSDQEPFGKYLQPPQRTAIVLRTLETMRDCCIDNKKNQWAKFMVEVAVRDSASWLMEVQKILRFLHENLKKSNSTSLLRQSFFLVLKALTNQFPREALRSVLTSLPSLDRYQPQQFPKHGVGQGQGCRIAWDLRGLSGSQLCGRGSPANRVFWACSTTLDIWKAMLSLPMTSGKILRELQNVLQDERVCWSLHIQTEHTTFLTWL
nr:uncharacterized protein LOC125181520 isoform X3 [Anser cygnoides]